MRGTVLVRTQVISFAAAAVVAAALGAAVPMPDQPSTSVQAKAFSSVLSCRGIADAVERLACFDRNAQTLQSAADNKEIIVVDRAEVQKARRSLFGFNLPGLKILGGKDPAERSAHGAVAAEDEEITSTVASAQQDRDGYWIVGLPDGAVWHQSGGTVALRPRPGSPVTIRRGSMGSYFIKFGKQPGVKAQRER